MNFKRIVTLSVAGEDAKRFKEVETWEGEFSFEIVTTSALPNGMDVEIFEKVKGSVSLSRTTIDPTGRQLDWKGASRIDLSMNGRKQMNMGKMSMDIHGSGGESGEGKASLSIDTVAGTYTLIVADGTSCRQQIGDGARRQAVHVARVLDSALAGRSG